MMKSNADHKISGQWRRKSKTLSLTTVDDVAPIHKYSHRKKIIIHIMTVVEVFLFGLIVHGWGFLAYVYKQSGIYENLCDDGHNITNNR